jgi:Common central domain of tyrosinase
MISGQWAYGDMTDFETAGRNPIFFAHHGNLDRLWEIWRKNAANKATEPQTDAFLKHSFVFRACTHKSGSMSASPRKRLNCCVATK